MNNPCCKGLENRKMQKLRVSLGQYNYFGTTEIANLIAVERAYNALLPSDTDIRQLVMDNNFAVYEVENGKGH